MNEDILLKIQDIVIQYVEIITKITKVSVDVINTNNIRVAGTGIFSDIINDSTKNKNYIEKKVIETAKRHIIYNPREDDLCKLCTNKDECRETFEIATPIFLKNEVIGVLSLIATDMKQREILLSDLDTYLDFVEQISYFIEAKANEYNETLNKNKTIYALTNIMNNVEQGVIILDKVGNIKNINDTALKQLKISNNVLEKNLFIQATGDTINGLNEYSIKIEDDDYVIIGNLYNLDIDDSEFSSVIVFKEQGFVHSDLYNMIPNINMVAVDNIVGNSKETLDLKKYIMKIAKSTSTVLITGESGTGKEMIATAIWKASNRKDKNFVAINCAAIPETLLESELFGYVKGAFTGANHGRIGKFEITSDGTLFLDEIGDMPIHLQTKLLRVLQEKEITRIGSNRQVKIDTRIIAATNKDLKKLIEENKFREDLYYRLNVIPVETLPLRERVDDIEDLTYMFIKRYTELFNKYFKKIDNEVMEFFKLYYWKGNVRELENTIEYVINMLDDNGIITMNMLPKSIIEEDSNNEFNDNSINTLEYLERNEIIKAINLYGDNTAGKRLAAKKLGVSLSTLYRKTEKFL